MLIYRSASQIAKKFGPLGRGLGRGIGGAFSKGMGARGGFGHSAQQKAAANYIQTKQYDKTKKQYDRPPSRSSERPPSVTVTPAESSLMSALRKLADSPTCMLSSPTPEAVVLERACADSGPAVTEGDGHCFVAMHEDINASHA